jgi:hypothetical protein
VRIRYVIVVAAGIVSLAACTSDGKPAANTTSHSTGTATTVGVASPKATGDCPKLATAAKNISAAQAALYTGGADSAQAISTLVDELKALQNGAPSDVKAALSDMATAFQAAAEVLQHPTAKNNTQLAELGAKLSADGQKISAYVTSKCGSS